MTSLQFVGDVSLWIGLLLAAVVALLSWRYYNRESFNLPRRLRWLLPLLRTSAFVLGVLLLTGPALHHRTTIGELGRVQIYLDASESMTLHDRHMSPGRKLLAAEQLGWIAPDGVDMSLLETADGLAAARGRFAQQLDSSADGGSTSGQLAVQQFLQALRSIKTGLTPSTRTRFDAELFEPLERAEAAETVDQSQLVPLADICQSIESSLRDDFERSLTLRLQSGDPSIQSALTLFDEIPRWRRAELGLSDSPADVLAKLRERHEVRLLQLSGATALPWELTRQSPESESSDSTRHFAATTDLSSGIVTGQQGAAVARETEVPVEQPQTAIVLLTDGQHNAGDSPVQSARILGGQGLAFYCVAIGATQPATDLAITGVENPEFVFSKDRVRGAITLHDSVPAGKPFVAQISYQDEVLWQQQLLTQNVPERRVEFEFAIEELADRLEGELTTEVTRNILPLTLTASLSPLPEELETANNNRDLRLAVTLHSDRVLILDGRARWETRYLRNAFERDEQWSVDTVIAGVGADEVALPRGEADNQFPVSRDALFDYDLVIFGEISPDLFAEHELQWLREFVELRGGGMILIDGQRSLLRQFNAASFGSLIPVAWSAASIAAKPTALHLTDRGAAESTFRLIGDEPRNRSFWSELPGPHSVVAVEALPGAEVLVEAEVAGERLAAVVTQRFGAGRVLYLAFDETWRWRYKSADTWHQRVWNQLARFVMPKPFAVSDDFVSIDTGKVSYAAGDSVDVRVRLLDLDGKPTSNPVVEALFWKDGQLVATTGLRSDPAIAGRYLGRSTPLTEGDYEVSIRAAGYSEAVLKARSTFVVLPPESGELARTSIDEALLRQMADASGGVYLQEEQLGTLPVLLSPLSSGRVVESDMLLWQSYWWFAAMILLLTTEWILRKRAGLL